MSSSSDRPVFAAIDIGASSGRVVAGWLDTDADGSGGLRLDIVHRFDNGAEQADGHLRWNLTGLYAEVLLGLRELATRYPSLVSIGIDTWAVDYGLLGADGELLAEPIAYRDDRTNQAIDEVHAVVDPQRLYAISGLQFLPFNTVYQLAAERGDDRWARTDRALLLPDLLAYWLTGAQRTEITNASTTGLLDARTRAWSSELFTTLDLPSDLFPPLVHPGEVIGTLRDEVCTETGLPAHVRVVAVGSHDTASAVVGVPSTDREAAYVSSGTWSLVGFELDQPVLTEASRQANFTNEGGVDGRIRYLRNVGGLWLLQESLRSWQQEGSPAQLTELLEQAAALPSGGPVIDVGAPEFLPPGDMPSRIREACVRQGDPAPADRAALVRCILDSLAEAYARTVGEAEALCGQHAAMVHVVGGGSQNELLCQLTADRVGRPVLSGPVEATAIGNLAVQVRAAGLLPADLDALRAELRRGLQLTAYTPAGSDRRHDPNRDRLVAP